MENRKKQKGIIIAIIVILILGGGYFAYTYHQDQLQKEYTRGFEELIVMLNKEGIFPLINPQNNQMGFVKLQDICGGLR